jgi:hypothetical protein
VIDFSGKGLFSSSEKKHSFEAKVYRHDADTPLYTVSGHWDGEFTIHDCKNDVDVETFDVMTAKITALKTEPLAAQDPWESRRAWQGVRDALERGDMQGAADAKARIENGQREMRKTDAGGKEWKRLFYQSDDSKPDDVAARLASQVGLAFHPEDTLGAWKFRAREWNEGQFKKPYHGDLLPDNSHVDGTTSRNTDAMVNGAIPAADTASQEQHDLSQTLSFHQQSTVVAVPAPEEVEEQRQPKEAESIQGTGTAHPPSVGKASLVADKTRHESPVVLAQPDRKGSVKRNANMDMNTRIEQKEGVEQVDNSVIIPKDMSIKEKAQVEEFLRDRYSTRHSR